MTFSRAKPAGWTDDIDTITATQINQIDTNQSRAVDGTAGGAYTPSPPININGLTATTVGLNVRAVGAQHPIRIDTTTVVDVAATQIIDASSADVYWISFVPSTLIDIELGVTSTAIAPVEGQLCRITRAPSASAPLAPNITVKSEGLAPIIGILQNFPSPPENQNNQTPIWIDFIFLGGQWILYAGSGDAIS